MPAAPKSGSGTETPDCGCSNEVLGPSIEPTAGSCSCRFLRDADVAPQLQLWWLDALLIELHHAWWSAFGGPGRFLTGGSMLPCKHGSW